MHVCENKNFQLLANVVTPPPQPAINLWQSSSSVYMCITSVVQDSLINNRSMKFWGKKAPVQHTKHRKHKKNKTHNDKHITQGGSEVVFPDKRNK
jgi:hypothetical protein